MSTCTGKDKQNTNKIIHVTEFKMQINNLYLFSLKSICDTV